MRLQNSIVIFFIFLYNFCQGQDTIIPIEDIIKIEREIAEEQKKSTIVFCSGLTLTLMALFEIYKKSDTFITYVVLGTFLEFIGVIQMIKARKREKEMNKIYNNMYFNAH